MSQYAELDSLIIEAIAQRKHPFYSRIVTPEATRLAEFTGRVEDRIIDGRLQALRKAGRICHLTKAEGGGSGGWKIVGEKP